MSGLVFNGNTVNRSEIELLAFNLKGLYFLLTDNRDIYFFNDIYEIFVIRAREIGIIEIGRSRYGLHNILNLISLLNRLGIVKYVRSKPPRKYSIDKQKLNDLIKSLIDYHKMLEKKKEEEAKNIGRM